MNTGYTYIEIIGTLAGIAAFAVVGIGLFWLFAMAVRRANEHNENKEKEQRAAESAQRVRRDKHEQGQAGLLVAIVVGIVLFGLAAGVLSWAKGKAPAQTVAFSDGIGMLQPQGANPGKDLTNSQTNLNNSEANLNNANAAAVPTLTDAEYQLTMAQACQLRGDCAVQTFNQGREAGAADAWTKLLMWIAMGCLGVFVLVLILKR